MLNAIFNTTVAVKRRASYATATRDALNNPVYGAPTSGATWSTIYATMPARLAFGEKPIEFAPTGERITPEGVMYFPPDYTVKAEDRILTNGIEYVVVSTVPGYMNNTIVDHYEAILKLP
jgi:hypothetical protein